MISNTYDGCMFTDQDIKKLKDTLATKADVQELRADHTNLEKKVDEIAEHVAQLPTKADLEAILERTFSLAALKAEHERMKEIIREQHGVQI